MARYRYGFDERRIQRFIKEGRGQGTGNHYKPWLTVSDVPSLGREHRVYCPKVGRELHLLSDNEWYSFLLHWWDDRVIDIREQFPLLDRRETLEIAVQCGIRHPVDPVSGALWVLTTDQLVTLRTNEGICQLAYAIKEADDLEDIRIVEKLEIERRWWMRRKVTWQLLTDKQVKTRYTHNLAWILDSGYEINGHLDAIRDEIISTARTQSLTPVRRFCAAIDSKFGHRSGTALAALRQLLATKRLTTDFHARFIQNLPVKAFGIGSAS